MLCNGAHRRDRIDASFLTLCSVAQEKHYFV